MKTLLHRNRLSQFLVKKPSRQQGFTLIEIMIAVTIIGILAAIALPNYSEYVIRSNVQTGIGTLSDYRSRMEQYYQDNRFYTDTAAGATCGVAVPTAKDWAISCVGTSQTYTLTAAGSGPVSGFTYTVNQANARTTTTTSATKWGAITKTEWVTRKGG
jgi:type IV pilus assembly protein PilE